MFDSIKTLFAPSNPIDAHPLDPTRVLKYDDTKRVVFNFPDDAPRVVRRKRQVPAPLPYIRPDPIVKTEPVAVKVEDIPALPFKCPYFIPLVSQVSSDTASKATIMCYSKDLCDHYVFDGAFEVGLLRLIDFLAKLYHTKPHLIFNLPHYVAGLHWPLEDDYRIFLNFQQGCFLIQRVLLKLQSIVKITIRQLLTQDVLRTQFFTLLEQYHTEVQANSFTNYQHVQVLISASYDTNTLWFWFLHNTAKELKKKPIHTDEDREFYKIPLHPPQLEDKLYVWELPTIDWSISPVKLARAYLFKIMVNHKPLKTLAFTTAQLLDRTYMAPKVLDVALVMIMERLQYKDSLPTLFERLIKHTKSRILLADLVLTVEALTAHRNGHLPFRPPVLTRLRDNQEQLLVCFQLSSSEE